MTELELKRMVQIVLQEAGVLPKPQKYVSQAKALKMLKEVSIGRDRLNRLISEGKVKVKDKENYDKRNSAVRIVMDVSKVVKYFKLISYDNTTK